MGRGKERVHLSRRSGFSNKLARLGFSPEDAPTPPGQEVSANELAEKLREEASRLKNLPRKSGRK